MNYPVRVTVLSVATDDSHRRRLEVHLLPLARRQILNVWSETNSSPGVDIHSERSKWLSMSDIIVVLLSADFIAREDFEQLEATIWERHIRGLSRIIPIVARPAYLAPTRLSRIKAFPESGIPLEKVSNAEDEWAAIAGHLHLAIKGWVDADSFVGAPSQRPGQLHDLFDGTAESHDFSTRPTTPPARVEEFLSSGVATMSFNDDWQFVVNDLVRETQGHLRGMVLEAQLRRWWRNAPGVAYTVTNLELLARGVDIRRIFVVRSLDDRQAVREIIRTASVHERLGAKVRVCGTENARHLFPAGFDMFSIHDSTFAALYCFRLEPATVTVMSDRVHVAEVAARYDELFADDALSYRPAQWFRRLDFNIDFFDDMEHEVDAIKSVASQSTGLERLRRTALKVPKPAKGGKGA